ncbi:MAG: helix-turn-helix domain-containing protein [Chloroflexota bacterium]|nr:helix-turn-helix domain-containing protein [Chloroflexota bacterium]
MAEERVFGDLLRRYRVAAGMTQEELAERAGLSVEGISTLERGARRAPRRDTLRLLAEALGLSKQDRQALVSAGGRRDERSSPSQDLLPNNLPPQPTPFIGREQEVGDVRQQLVRPDLRLLTLTGPGGIGKTRLALEAAAGVLEEFPDGVYFVPLAPIADPSLVVPTIARTLGLAEAGARPIAETLVEHLRGRRMLLVLDNFEHLLEAVSEVASLLLSCPRLAVLATSRACLRLRGEQEYPVPPLELPEARHLTDLALLSRNQSVAIFVQGAAAVKPGFAVTSQTAPAIAAICRKLDGLPLAIELAAARVRLFPPQVLLARLDSRLKLLTGGAKDLPERQQTLRSCIGWSYDLLGESEKALFRSLAVFVGGCSLEAIEAICDPEGELDALEGVESLAEKSLLRQEEEVGREPRFVMLETWRDPRKLIQVL